LVKYRTDFIVRGDAMFSHFVHVAELHTVAATILCVE
jgi:hypothetical protein